MTHVLIAVTGVDHWSLADGSKHPSGFWPEELSTPHRIFTEAGMEITIATPGGVEAVADQVGYAADYNGGSEEAGQALKAHVESIAALRSPPSWRTSTPLRSTSSSSPAVTARWRTSRSTPNPAAC